MRSLRRLLLMGALLAGVAPITALAQTGGNQTSPTIAGSNTVDTSIAGPGGQIQTSTVAQFRNATAIKLFSGLTGVQTYTAVNVDSTLYWVGTAPTSWTITTPSNPWDGEILSIATDTTLTSMVTLTAASGQTLNSSYTNQTLSAKTSVEFQYAFSTKKWYELR